MQKRKTLDLLFETELRHLYSAEHEIKECLDNMINQAVSTKLKQDFVRHLEETKGQIEQIEKIFKHLKIDPTSSRIDGIPGWADKGKELFKTLVDMNFTDRSKGIDGIVSEAKELIRHFGGTDANDAALLCASQKVEHFEMACYLSLIELAKELNLEKLVAPLNLSKKEEEEMSHTLSEDRAHEGKGPKEVREEKQKNQNDDDHKHHGKKSSGGQAKHSKMHGHHKKAAA